MAQTKRKRRTKHRGNAAGMIEARGRTGSGSAGANKGTKTAAQLRAERMDRPPSWSAATTRAAITSVIFGLVLAFVLKKELAQVIGLTGFMFLLYIPAGYSMDAFIYKRRMAKKAPAKGKR